LRPQIRLTTRGAGNYDITEKLVGLVAYGGPQQCQLVDTWPQPVYSIVIRGTATWKAMDAVHTP
jgi:hypothetical protein